MGFWSTHQQLKDIRKSCVNVKLLDAVDGIISIKTHLKGAFGLSGILDLSFLFIEDISNDMQRGPGSILGYTSYQTFAVWYDVELKIDPDPFCTSCQISSMNKKPRSKIPLNPKAPFKWVFMDIIPSTSPKSLTSDTIVSKYLLIVDA